MAKVIITNIQRFSIHDGPGVRTVVFFKGCPLNCPWCANPETKTIQKEIIVQLNKCIGCGYCEKECKTGALIFKGRPFIERSKCIACGACATVCYAKALELQGKDIEVNELIDEVLKDKPFFDKSGGGLTISGGEALMQPYGASELLKLAKQNGINTAIETTGFATSDVFAKVIENCDTILFDLKHTDDKQHREYIGVSNNIILNNLLFAAKSDKKIVVRIPLIPGFNMSAEYAASVANIMTELKLDELHVLPFHQMARGKYIGLDKEYAYADVPPPTDEQVEEFADMIRKSDIKVLVGG